MAGLEWLTARPIAHRGLHDAARGVIENTASAAAAAVAAGYGIEADLQLSADGEAMVHHDDTLDRLTEGAGALRGHSAAALKGLAYRVGTDRMMTLGDLLDLAADRVPLVLELKSRFDGDRQLAHRVAATLRGRRGPVAAMSFDPTLMIALAERAPRLARGIVGQSQRLSPEGKDLAARAAGAVSAGQALAALRARPGFLAWRIQDIATPPPLLARRLFGLPLLTWTVRSERERAIARRYAAQVIFEGFRPVMQPFVERA